MDVIHPSYHTGDDPKAQTRQAMLSNAVVRMSKVHHSLQVNVFEPFALSTMSVLHGEDHWLNSVGLIVFWQESSSCKNFIDGTSLGHLDLGCQAFVLNGWKDVMEKSFSVGIFPKKRLITVLILDFPMGLNFIAAHDRAGRMQEEVLLLLFCSYWLSSQNFVVLWL